MSEADKADIPTREGSKACIAAINDAYDRLCEMTRAIALDHDQRADDILLTIWRHALLDLMRAGLEKCDVDRFAIVAQVDVLVEDLVKRWRMGR